MPSKNRIKTYVEGGFYHIYNRGVEKRIIFQDEEDYVVFLHLLKYYLSPSEPNHTHPSSSLDRYKIIRPRPIANLHNKIKLLCYCLMPNHYHLLIKQVENYSMPHLINKLCTTYSMHFNKKYDRVGPLFQGPYKAILVDNENYLTHLSSYIHKNPEEIAKDSFLDYPYSSIPYYLRKKTASWVNIESVLEYFKGNSNTYKDYVLQHKPDCDETINRLRID